MPLPIELKLSVARKRSIRRKKRKQQQKMMAKHMEERNVEAEQGMRNDGMAEPPVESTKRLEDGKEQHGPDANKGEGAEAASVDETHAAEQAQETPIQVGPASQANMWYKRAVTFYWKMRKTEAGK